LSSLFSVVKPEVSLCIQHDKGNNIRDVPNQGHQKKNIG